MIDLDEPRRESTSLLEKNKFELIDSITETYKKTVGCVTYRYQNAPIYSLFKCTASSLEDPSFCIEWVDLYALNIIRSFKNVVSNLPSFIEGRELDDFIDKTHGKIYNKDL